MNKLIKKIISTFLSVCIIWVAYTPVFADVYEVNLDKDESFLLNNILLNTKDDSFEILDYIVKNDGVKEIMIQYENGITSQIKEKQVGNLIYLNVVEGLVENELIIDTKTNSMILDGNKIEVGLTSKEVSIKDGRAISASWIYSKDPLYGSSSDYTRFLSTTRHNVDLKKAVEGIALTIFISIITVAIAGTGIGLAVMGVGIQSFYTYLTYNLPGTIHVYVEQEQKYHKTLNLYKRHVYKYFKDNTYTNPFSSSLFYSGWAGL